MVMKFTLITEYLLFARDMVPLFANIRTEAEPTIWSRILLDKLVIPQLVKKFPVSYGT
jgi:hypothetical protein